MLPSSLQFRVVRSVRVLFFVAGALCLLGTVVSSQRPRFYPDDPIAREPESQNVPDPKLHEIGSLYEMTYNLFVTAAYKASGTRAKNINTIDEVPDSGWFTNRVLPRRLPARRRSDR